MKTFVFTPENEKKFQEQSKKYPNSDAMMLPCLWLTPIQVYEVATFYTMFNLKPIGTYHIEVCKTLSCMMMGANDLIKFIKDTIGIEPGQTSKDGKFHLSQVECLGACGGAPMFALNGQYHENQSVSSLGNLIKECK